jgi:hypothetical protein
MMVDLGMKRLKQISQNFIFCNLWSVMLLFRISFVLLMRFQNRPFEVRESV